MSEKNIVQPIVQPMIDEMKERQKPKPGKTKPVPFEAPPEAAELDQDPGGGYNPDHTVPQG